MGEPAAPTVRTGEPPDLTSAPRQLRFHPKALGLSQIEETFRVGATLADIATVPPRPPRCAGWGPYAV